MTPKASRRARLWAVSSFVALLAIAALRHHAALWQPTPQQDEPIFVEAATRMASGLSPYSQERYNYPPPLAALGAFIIPRAGDATFLALVRSANLVALVGLTFFAAGFAGLAARGRFLLTAGVLLFSPIAAYALWIGNLTPIAAGFALAGWRLGERRPVTGVLLVATSLALKPLALVGVIYLAGRALVARPGSPRRVLSELAPLAVALLALLPWAGELPDLAQRMTEPPLFSSRNLSLRRILDGCGLDVPATALMLGVLTVALLLARRRPVDREARMFNAPVVALLALPVSWAHGFLFVLPLQVAAARRWWERRAKRRRPGGSPEAANALAESWGIPLALAVIQGSVSAGVEFAASEGLRSAIVALPVLAPTALLAYCAATSDSRQSRGATSLDSVA